MASTQPILPSSRTGVLDPHGIVVYPDSDGKPMAENDPQYRAIVNTRFALEQHYLHESHVYIGADLLIYYEEGDTTKSVAPDVFASLGVPKTARRTYQIWMEGKAPDVVFEFASLGTWRADVSWKRGLYLGIGVQEYFLFDPTGEFFQPILQGYRLNENPFQPLPPLEVERGVRGLRSDVLGVELWAQPSDMPGIPYALRVYNPATGVWLPTPEEAAEGQRNEAAARAAAEARLRELEAELHQLRGETS
ncbi:MAG: Uma2 family endonuclease [Roseiflexaceae bacterium]